MMVSKTKLRRWEDRAMTIRFKAEELWSQMELELSEDQDFGLLDAASAALTSACELHTALEEAAQ